LHKCGNILEKKCEHASSYSNFCAASFKSNVAEYLLQFFSMNCVFQRVIFKLFVCNFTVWKLSRVKWNILLDGLTAFFLCGMVIGNRDKNNVASIRNLLCKTWLVVVCLAIQWWVFSYWIENDCRSTWQSDSEIHDHCALVLHFVSCLLSDTS